MSALMSTRKEMFEYLSITNIRRDTRPSSLAAFTDGWFSFPYSKCMGNGTSSRVLEMCGMRGSNEVRTVVVSLLKSISDDSGFVFVAERVLPRLSAFICACIWVIRSLNTLMVVAKGSLAPTFCAGGLITAVILR